MSTAMWLIAFYVVIDIVVVVAGSIAIGAAAPRWPRHWLEADRGPLRLTRLDAPAAYRRIRIASLTRRRPELGGAFGGESKRRLPGTDPSSIESYLVEVRRAEWAHWGSCLTIVLIAIFNPWWLTLAFAGVVLGVNGAFILVLRHNRTRLLRILKRG